jgi:hypothetical protein
MNIHPDDGRLFYKLYSALMFYANQRLQVLEEPVADVAAYEALSPQSRMQVRDAFYAQPELLGQFVQANPANLAADELEIVASWRHAVVGKFYVVRHLKNYTVFLSNDQSPNKAYGVLGLADPLEEVVSPYLPVFTGAVLLPFKGQIIYDGLLDAYAVTFGGNIRRSIYEEYQEAKEAFGIITALPEGSQPPPAPKKPKTRKIAKIEAPATKSGAILETLVEMIDSFCSEFLNDEYAELCRKLATTLARKRPSPLLQGKLETWACGIVRTIGWVNYLDDRSQTPHLKLTFIDKAFGVAESTGQGKSKLIRTMLKIRNFDPRWTLPTRMDDNPVVWMLEVNGFLMDIRSAPREVQVVAFERGLIPYIPADREEAGE